MIIYTDGSALSNGSEDNSGGFGIVVLDDDEHLITTISSRTNTTTTNNREEMKAILYTLKLFGEPKAFKLLPTVYSDSAYAVNTFNTWMYDWVRRGWQKSDGTAPENLDLVKRYYELTQKGYDIDLRKCKGHAGNPWNELADALATGRKKGMNVVGD